MALEAFINGDKQKRAKKRGRTLRFDLELAPPTEASTNEFSYTELAEGEQRKREGLPKLGDTPEKATDNQMVALAQRLEEKYGAPVKKKKKQRVFESDLIDRGHGYDTNDSFVDDSEMYEDYVPPQVDTKFGGFYVNTGDLEFTAVWQTENDEDMDALVKKKKKPRMKKQGSHQTPQSILASQKLKKAKQHVAAQKVPKPKAGKVLFKTSSLTASSSTSSSVFVKSPHKKPPGPAIIKKKREMGDGQSLLPLAPSLASLPSIALSAEPSATPSGQPGKSEGGELGKKGGEGPETPKPPPVLPEELPEEISSTVKLFEESVARDQASTPEGKISVKTRGAYDEQLTELELACRKLPMKKRIAVLQFVSHKLGVSRATTIKRVRQVMKKREEEALAQPLHMLKEAVDASMPEQLQSYEQELRARAESLSTAGEKVSVASMEVEDDVTVDEVFEESSNAATEMKEAAAKAKRAPRKKYKWTEETRHLLCEVVRVKVESEELMKGRANGEEVLMEFLDSKIKLLWPKGWMQKSILYKMTEPVHRHFTAPQSKKAATTATKKPDKDKPTDQKKADISSQTSPLALKKVPESRESSPHLSQVGQSPTANSPRTRESPENAQWSVRSVNTSTGSPITIVRKAPASSGANSSASDASGGGGGGVQITPRMAQILSSVASSQALVKASKMASSLPVKASPSSLSTASQPSKKQGKVALHSDVQALLSQFQSPHVKFADLVKSPSVSSTPGSSSSARASHAPSQAPSQTSLSSAPGTIKGVPQARGPSGVGKLSSPSSKITTSPIQMKTIVSQLKPKVPSQGKPLTAAASKQPSPPSLSLVITSQKKPVTSFTQPKPSPSVSTNPALLSKVKKSLVATSAGPTVQLPKITGAFSLATNMSNQQGSAQNFFSIPLPGSGQSEHGRLKKTSPPKGGGKAAAGGHAKPHPQATPSVRRPDHATVIQRNQAHSTSPYSHPSSSSSSSQSHLPLSAIVHQAPPSLQNSSPPPLPPLSSSTGIVSRLSATNKQLSASPLAAQAGTPITAILLPQQQPTYVVANQPHLLAQQSEPTASFTATTIPFSSCASTFILTSPLSGGHFGHHHTPKATPPHTHHTPKATPPHTHHLHHRQAPPPLSLAISPSTVPVAGAQVVVGGVSGTGIRSPVEQIYLEHSYGGQSGSDPTHTGIDGGFSSRKQAE